MSEDQRDWLREDRGGPGAAALRQDYTAWYVDYPRTHVKAGETVEVVPRELLRAAEARLAQIAELLEESIHEDIDGGVDRFVKALGIAKGEAAS